MTKREDGRIYQAALSELRDKHRNEFHAIRERMLREAGIEINVVADYETRILAAIAILVQKQGDVSMSDVSRYTKINSETTRNKMHKLAEQGKVKLTEGRRKHTNTGGGYKVTYVELTGL